MSSNENLTIIGSKPSRGMIFLCDYYTSPNLSGNVRNGWQLVSCRLCDGFRPAEAIANRSNVSK